MARILTTLYVTDHRARVGIKDGSLTVSQIDRKITRIPIESIESVIIIGHGQVTTDALAECVRRHIRVASLSQSGRIRFMLAGPTQGSVYLRLAQVHAFGDDTSRDELARSFVAAKVQNSIRLLRRWSWDARPTSKRYLNELSDQLGNRLGSIQNAFGERLLGIEGDASRLYFKGLGNHLEDIASEYRFEGRNRRPPRDPVNCLLSFCYGLLTVDLAGALDAIGLDPQIGYLHALRPARPALALDILEEFRPAFADRFVVRELSRKRIKGEDFIRGAAGAVWLNDDGRRKLLQDWERYKEEIVVHSLLGREVQRFSLPSIQAVLLARFLSGDLPSYPPFVMEI